MKPNDRIIKGVNPETWAWIKKHKVWNDGLQNYISLCSHNIPKFEVC